MFINQALLAAWKSACKVSGATVKVPSELNFLIKPLTLQGPCMPDLTLQVRFSLLFNYHFKLALKYKFTKAKE